MHGIDKSSDSNTVPLHITQPHLNKKALTDRALVHLLHVTGREFCCSGRFPQ
jgi:hypothetical protein